MIEHEREIVANCWNSGKTVRKLGIKCTLGDAGLINRPTLLHESLPQTPISKVCLRTVSIGEWLHSKTAKKCQCGIQSCSASLEICFQRFSSLLAIFWSQLDRSISKNRFWSKSKVGEVLGQQLVYANPSSTNFEANNTLYRWPSRKSWVD